MEHTPLLAVVVVGGPEQLVEATKRVAELVANALVVTADVKAAATQIARIRPCAIIISDEIYAFDSAEFDALARDVQAELISVTTDGGSVRALQHELTPRIMDAFRDYFKN
ncbi:MAG: hypothetical protein RL701_3893 [Pseudomonadota bacterium]|jgi:hypothetical protein